MMVNRIVSQINKYTWFHSFSAEYIHPYIRLNYSFSPCAKIHINGIISREPGFNKNLYKMLLPQIIELYKINIYGG